jgi:hypothetical protein
MLRKFDLRSVRTDHMESHRTLFAWVKMQCSVLDDFVGLWKERYTDTRQNHSYPVDQTEISKAPFVAEFHKLAKLHEVPTDRGRSTQG